MGLALGGSAGVRLGCKLRLTSSRNTLLRRVRQAPMPSVVTPAALGVDDWALRKRTTYGPILADLERHRPVALLLSLSKGRPRGGHTGSLTARASRCRWTGATARAVRAAVFAGVAVGVAVGVAAGAHLLARRLDI